MGRKLGFLFFILITVDVAAVAQDMPDRSADELAIRRVTQEFILRRESGDEDGLRALLTTTCDQRLTSGRMRSGRTTAGELFLRGQRLRRSVVRRDLAGIIPLRWCARTPDYTRAGELLGQVVAPQGNVVL